MPGDHPYVLFSIEVRAIKQGTARLLLASINLNAI